MLRLLPLLILLLLPQTLLAAPAAELWGRWNAHNANSPETIDHSRWQELLRRHVRPGSDHIARVDYAGFSDNDRDLLDSYINKLAAQKISSYRKTEQKAYWINLYNALTVQVILRHYPVESIRDIDLSSGWFTDGPWEEKLIRIEGEPVSLDDIEHRILRPIWRDPRIHYAVNCASLGCPDLSPDAFQADRLDQQLDQAARIFINHPRAVRIEEGKLTVSSIYHWFDEDFGANDKAIIDHLASFAAPALKQHLIRLHTIDRHQYDWRLNDIGN